MSGDAEMMRYITRGKTWTGQAVDEFLSRQQRHLANHGVCFGAVGLRECDTAIGLAGMQPHDDGRFELGWWIWKAHWGRGYATEAMQPFITHARDAMRLDCLVAVIDPSNKASQRVAAKLGFHYLCTRSARETIATREDIPIGYYRLNLGASNTAASAMRSPT